VIESWVKCLSVPVYISGHTSIYGVMKGLFLLIILVNTNCHMQ